MKLYGLKPFKFAWFTKPHRVLSSTGSLQAGHRYTHSTHWSCKWSKGRCLGCAFNFTEPLSCWTIGHYISFHRAICSRNVGLIDGGISFYCIWVCWCVATYTYTYTYPYTYTGSVLTMPKHNCYCCVQSLPIIWSQLPRFYVHEPLRINRMQSCAA